MRLDKWQPPGPGHFLQRPINGEEWQLFYQTSNGPTKCLMQYTANDAAKMQYLIDAANRLAQIDADLEARREQESA